MLIGCCPFGWPGAIFALMRAGITRKYFHSTSNMGVLFMMKMVETSRKSGNLWYEKSYEKSKY